MLRLLTTVCLASLAIGCLTGQARAQTTKCDPGKVAANYPNYASKVVKIAATPTGMPFEYSDPKDPDQMTGLEVDMVESAMKCAGLKFEYEKGAWAGLLQSMFSGSADIMIGNVNFRPDRAEKVSFVLYMLAGGTVAVQKGNPKGIATLSDLCGKSGSATVGGSSALEIERQSKECVAQGKPPIDFLPASDVDAAYRQVANGRNDFAMDDAGSAAARLKSDPNLAFAFTVKSDRQSGFVVAKGNSEILKALTQGLQAEESDGTLIALMKKYGLDAGLLTPVKTVP
jgi:polar amino acid transport system substrate-binding protein